MIRQSNPNGLESWKVTRGLLRAQTRPEFSWRFGAVVIFLELDPKRKDHTELKMDG